MRFEVRLPLFEGPFDLLLFFIERDELNIHDIPIARIADEFLTYVHQLEQFNLEMASEFILVAASLMRIKVKMLLPRPELDAEGKEVDPRAELVQHLLEYKKYKSVVAELAALEAQRASRTARGNALRELQQLAAQQGAEAELQSLDLYKLLRVFERVLHRHAQAQHAPVHAVVQYPFTVAQQKEVVLGRLKQARRCAFSEIIAENPNRMHTVFTFLAILELLQLQHITLQLGEGFNNFWIEASDSLPLLVPIS